MACKRSPCASEVAWRVLTCLARCTRCSTTIRQPRPVRHNGDRLRRLDPLPAAWWSGADWPDARTTGFAPQRGDAMRSPRWHAIPLGRVAVPLLLLALVAALAAPAAAARPAQVIILPGATSAEGIAAGDGASLFAGDLFAGDIF